MLRILGAAERVGSERMKEQAESEGLDTDRRHRMTN
jgi:hypothetical protein